MSILYRDLKSLNLFLLVFLLAFTVLYSVHLVLPMCIELMIGSYYMVRLHFQEYFHFWIENGLINFFLGSWWYGYIFNIDSCFVLSQASVSLLASERVTIWVDYLLLINGCCGISSSPISLLGCISAYNLYIVSSTIAECL